MPETFYKTGIYKSDHTTYAGELTIFDFEGHHTLESMARKILNAFCFDKQCQKKYRI